MKKYVDPVYKEQWTQFTVIVADIYKNGCMKYRCMTCPLVTRCNTSPTDTEGVILIAKSWLSEYCDEEDLLLALI